MVPLAGAVLGILGRRDVHIHTESNVYCFPIREPVMGLCIGDECFHHSFSALGVRSVSWRPNFQAEMLVTDRETAEKEDGYVRREKVRQ